MNRRHFFRQAAGLAALPLAGFSLSGCSQAAPVDVKWGESTCAVCNMVIAEKRFAAQIRDAAGKHHLFDDVGCGIRWLKTQGVPEDKVSFWVMDYRGGYWVDAFKAQYLPGKPSPMGYDLAALTVPGEGIPFSQARDRVLAKVE